MYAELQFCINLILLNRGTASSTYFIPMKFINSLLTLLFILSLQNIEAQTILTEKSTVNFSIKNLAINTVKGSFGGMKGEINFDRENLSDASFNVCIDANSINTGITKRDEHLRKEDFFDVEKYPTICFTSTNIINSKMGYTARGNLTLHGVTKEVTIPFTIKGSTFVGNIEILRKDFGVGANYGGFTVGKTVKIEIICMTE